MTSNHSPPRTPRPILTLAVAVLALLGLAGLALALRSLSEPPSPDPAPLAYAPAVTRLYPPQAQISTRPAPGDYPPLQVDWQVIGGGLDPGAPDDKTVHQVEVTARGGDGAYAYYLIRDERAPLAGQGVPGPIISVPWVRCGVAVARLLVRSGDGQEVSTRLQFFAYCPTPTGCRDCDEWYPGKGTIK